jgi:hypothetical protein
MKLFCCYFACVMTLCGAACAQTTHPDRRQRSCRTFVQEFYDWYVPKASADRPPGDTTKNSWEVALKNRRSAFTPELYRALREDADAQDKVEEYSVGIDFDPFLYTQNPEDHYVIEHVTVSGQKCRVEVHGVKSGTSNEVPTPVAELTLSNGQWRFANFRYGKNELSDDEDLLSTLKSLKRDRQKK